MTILHICLTGPYTDGFNYQENLLARYHRKAGHEVYVLAPMWMWDREKVVRCTGETEYVNADGVHVIRLPIRGERDIGFRFKRYEGLYGAVERIRPDVMFIHNLQFPDTDTLCRYAREHEVTVYADNHADFSNSARSGPARLFYRLFWRRGAKRLEPLTRKFYGVLPARVDFLKDMYGLPESKCELLVMGADDEEVKKAAEPQSICRTRAELGFAQDDFVIVTGGKIDEWKKQTLLLMQAVSRIGRPRVRLLVFGPVALEIRPQFDALLDARCMRHIGWADSADSYRYFAMADLVVFPGRHSVYWEQAAGQGKPMLCKYWAGTTHVDMGGNVQFLREDSAQELQARIEALLDDPQAYARMKDAAQRKGAAVFSYRSIAARAIEDEQ